MQNVNKFCVQNVGALNVKSGGTHRYTSVHRSPVRIAVKAYPHFVQPVYCDRLTACQLVNHFLKNQSVYQNNEITSGINPIRNG